ncbi:MAG: sigma-54-dependent Fis family transcriptional regulator [Acidobacteria bacterium]|nr:MAG: sigma-54-dependent Fis family transcriptional regulator [Acidobacteriota bacterium]
MTSAGTSDPAVSASRDTLTICILDDEAAVLEMLQSTVEQMGYPTLTTTAPEEALEHIQAGRCRVVLSDIKMPAMDGLAFLERVLEHDPGVYVILMTGFYSVDSAIEAVRRGAYDYLCKPVDRARLKKNLDELSELFSQRRRIRELEERLLPDLEFHGIVGKSPAMLEVFDLARKVAKHYTNVLLTGPTGTGKELVAQAIHQMSPVAQNRFVVCNCSADTRPGLFEYASGGTVFLDEVGEMSPPMQAKLLRVIQNREIQRVGAPEVGHVDVRLIAATNRDLRAEVLAGRYREDLFYRLSSIQIRLPSLTERVGDIPILVQFFLKKYNEAYGKQLHGLTRRAQAVLMQHSWPGNVRELENVISGACITAANDFIDVDDFPKHLQKPLGRAGPGGETWRPLPLEEVRRLHIQRVLEMCEGNRVRAAQVLGIGRTSLYRYLKRAAKNKAGATAA